jgi:hypothetical protein
MIVPMKELDGEPVPVSVPKPSDFMRAWHPELFSDSVETEPPLPRELFEFHLDEITSKRKELEFEDFCRRLAERELCPNLRPQTGPIGGGDSGVDAATYPVSQDLAERRYWYSVASPPGGPWAFAFSAKKAWHAKVSEDVQKAVNTGDGYTRVYFISNQLIADRKRAETERRLRREHGIDVQILDRQWIVDCVYEHGLLDLAIKSLGMSVQRQTDSQLGPLDLSRSDDLAALQKRLSQPASYYGNDYALAQDYLEAALLARGLGRPRAEVEGYFAKASDLASKVGYTGLSVRVLYTRAWTAFFWYDDAEALARTYAELEQHLPAVTDADQCQLFTNLWRLLHVAAGQGVIGEEAARLVERLEAIRARLAALTADHTRPNNSLQARTALSLLDMHMWLADPVKAAAGLAEFEACLNQSAGLGTYPLMRYVDVVRELGPTLADVPGFDALFERVCEITKQRMGETEEGRLLYGQGIRLSTQDHPRDVLRYLGKARIRLLKEETLRLGVRAALGCCDAYQAMGRFWAARMEALLAAQFALRRIEDFYEYPVEGILAVRRLALLELRLGRIGPFIGWFQLMGALTEHLQSIGYAVEKAKADLQTMDRLLGCHILNRPSTDALTLAPLKDTLDDLGLPGSQIALAYATGDLSSVEVHMPDELRRNRRAMHDFFDLWRDQPAVSEMILPELPETSPQIRYRTSVYGVQYTTNVANSYAPIAFAENLLGIIEAALALARWEDLAFVVDDVEFAIGMDLGGKSPPDLPVDKPPGPEGYRLVFGPDMLSWLQSSPQEGVGAYLQTALVMVLLHATVDPLEDIEAMLAQWHSEETFSRALGSSPTIHAVDQLLGADCCGIQHWF